jgi:hypothetical protein
MSDRVLSRPVVQSGVFGLAILIVLVALARWFWPDARPPTAQALLQQALGQGSDEEQLRAAIDLSRHADATPEMLIRVARDGRSDPVRAAAIQGLGQKRDVDTLPMLIGWMEDESLLVRARAVVSAEQIIGLRYGFNADDTAEQRALSIKRYRDFWAECQKPESQFIERMRKHASEKSKRE